MTRDRDDTLPPRPAIRAPLPARRPGAAPEEPDAPSGDDAAGEVPSLGWPPALPGRDGRPLAGHDADRAAPRVPHLLVEAPDAPRRAAMAIGPAIAALAPCAPRTLCSAEQYDALLDCYRQFVVATVVVAIASAWDSGRLAFVKSESLPFESEVFGLAGRRCGLADHQQLEALVTLNEAVAAVEAAQTALGGRPSPFSVLCTEHGLSQTAALVLLLAAAPALWGEIARGYGILANDVSRPVCDEHLLWLLMGATVGRRELSRQLDADGPLIRRGLVRHDGKNRPFQHVEADPSVVRLLAGSPVDTDIEPGVVLVPARVPLDQLMIPTEVIDRALADLTAAPPGVARVVVRGCHGAGRRTLLATLAQHAGRTLAMIDAARLVRDSRLRELPALLARAQLRGWLPCVDGLDTIATGDGVTVAAVRELLQAHPGPLAVRLPRRVQPPLEPGYVMIDVPISTVAERAAQWAAAAAHAGLRLADADHLAARFTVGPGTIHSVVTAVARTAPIDTTPAIESALRQHFDGQLGTVATRVSRLASWSQVVVPDAVQDSVAELISRVRHRRTVYDTWGFDQVMSSSRGLTVLLQGGPGTGKTLLACALARELGLDLYRVDLARVMSKWIGETEQNLARVFDAAEQGHALILFDEADSLFGQRTQVVTANDRYANLETNYLLQRLDTFEGVAVLTTNHGTAIDTAFKRRLTCCITLPFPDADARERLWRIHLPAQLPITGELDLGDLARRYEMSGGFIRNAALRAAFLAAHDQTALSQFHLERAIRAEFREAGKQAKSGVLE